MKNLAYIFIFICVFCCWNCTGSKKYFKAAERLEKQGLVDDAANYYLQSLQRKPTFVDARLKLKEVGQKHISNLASDFFRSYNTQQLEESLKSFETLKEFYSSSQALNIELNYPKTYDEDYKKAVESYCEKNYLSAYNLVYEKKYEQAIPFINHIKKYNTSYKTTQQLDIKATCEPLYQKAILFLENKNYSSAISVLSEMKNKTDNYKDANDLMQLCSGQLVKSYIIFEPKSNNNQQEKEIESYLYNNFSQLGLNLNSNLSLLNNTPFQNANAKVDLYNSNNIDLLQAIQKASGANFYYVFDVKDIRADNSNLTKTKYVAYREVKVRKNDTTVITEYRPLEYNLVKASSYYGFDFNSKVINAQSGQIINSQVQNLRSTDKVEYQEFIKNFDGNISQLFPYNPQATNPQAQYNPRNWRNLFTARSNLKGIDELKDETLNQSISLFKKSISTIK